MDGILLVNKPSGITSHDLVMKVRKKLMTQKIGHTGTLDPLANGVMILTVGKATKILPYITNHDKEYVAVLKLGIRTNTLDVTGDVLEEREINKVTEEQIREVFESFIGPQKQVPPMFSAKKINGKKLYELAREDIEIEREACDIVIHEMELLDFNGNDEIRFRVSCSAGTYIRVLCEDIAERLGNIGTMK
ncbi:MAG: tRNA pseudouridine(55) synthase TruB, partial [Erysipelotrichaceae bacterium]|nr:tRNA pseudouridine(55) synthase TruB [Erysipelotrichaceae bacterium]